MHDYLTLREVDLRAVDFWRDAFGSRGHLCWRGVAREGGGEQRR